MPQLQAVLAALASDPGLNAKFLAAERNQLGSATEGEIELGDR